MGIITVPTVWDNVRTQWESVKSPLNTLSAHYISFRTFNENLFQLNNKLKILIKSDALWRKIDINFSIGLIFYFFICTNCSMPSEVNTSFSCMLFKSCPTPTPPLLSSRGSYCKRGNDIHTWHILELQQGFLKHRCLGLIDKISGNTSVAGLVSPWEPLL